MSFWDSRRITVTGGAGFLGTHLTRKLEESGAREVFVPQIEEYDLRDLSAIRKMLSDSSPDIVIHLAARVGGIGANMKYPAEFFYDNLMMGVPLFHECWKAEIEKFVAIGTVCAYTRGIDGQA